MSMGRMMAGKPETEKEWGSVPMWFCPYVVLCGSRPILAMGTGDMRN